MRDGGITGSYVSAQGTEFINLYGLSQFTGVAVNANADAQLVREVLSHLMWDAIMFLAGRDFSFHLPVMRGYVSISTPIRRDWDFLLENALRRLNHRQHFPAVAGDLDDEIENALTRLAVYNEQPLAVMPFIPSHIYTEVFDAFFSGDSTPHETAQRLQAYVQQWMDDLP